MTSSSAVNACSCSVRTKDDTKTVYIAWIDAFELTRELITGTIAGSQHLFRLVPSKSVSDCIQETGLRIDLIVYHDHEPGSINVDEIAALRAAFAVTPILILSNATKVAAVAVKGALINGASGFILANQTTLKKMLFTLDFVASGGTVVPDNYLHQIVKPNPESKRQRPGGLSARELDVLNLIKCGRPNKLIAYDLKIGVSTVKVYLRSLMRKMGSPSRTHLAMNADIYLEAWAAENQEFVSGNGS